MSREGCARIVEEETACQNLECWLGYCSLVCDDVRQSIRQGWTSKKTSGLELAERKIRVSKCNIRT
jgi:hypothetical protein